MLQGTLPPIAAALLLVSLGGARLLPLAAGLGLLVAYGLLKRWPDPPTELWFAPNGTEWLLWCLAAAAVLALLEHFRLWRGRLAAGSAVLLGGLGAWLVLAKVAARWPLAETLLHVGLGGLVTAGLALLLRASLHRARPGLLPAIAVTVLLSADAALLVGFGGSALLGQLCGALAAAVGAGLGTALWRRPFALGPGDGTWLGIAHGLFLLAGVHLASLPWLVAVFAAAAPALLLVLPGRTK